MIEVIIERWTGPDGIAPFSVPPGGATVFCSLSGPKIAPSDREFGALNNARTSVVRNVRFWLDSEVTAISPVRPLCPQQQTFERRCPLPRRFRLLHLQEQTFQVASPESVPDPKPTLALPQTAEHWVPHHAPRKAHQDRRKVRAPRTRFDLPDGRGRDPTGFVRQHPAPD